VLLRLEGRGGKRKRMLSRYERERRRASGGKAHYDHSRLGAERVNHRWKGPLLPLVLPKANCRILYMTASSSIMMGLL
jgi:hypothetical protein